VAGPGVSAPLLELAGVGCERDGRWLFRHLDLRLEAGAVVALTGPNGSGKSTLLRCILGLYPDYEGRIHAAAPLYLGHRLGLDTMLSAEENLRWYQALRPPEDGAAVLCRTAAEALERVGMAGYERVACRDLSAGQQRRVALARMLLCPARLWLLDEPLTALDAAGARLVDGLLEAQADAGGAVLCATHQPLGIASARRLELGRTGVAAAAAEASPEAGR